MFFKKFISFGISAICALSCSTLSYAMILVNSLPKIYKTEEDLKYYDCFEDCEKTESDVACNLQVESGGNSPIYNLCKKCAYKMILTELEKHKNGSKFIKENINKGNNEFFCPSCKQKRFLEEIGFCPSCYQALFCKLCYKNTCDDTSKHCNSCCEPLISHYCKERNESYIHLTPFRFSLSETVYGRDSGFDSWNAFMQSLINRNVGLSNSEINGILMKKTMNDPFWILRVSRK